MVRSVSSGCVCVFPSVRVCLRDFQVGIRPAADADDEAQHGQRRASLRAALSAEEEAARKNKLAIYMKAIRVALEHCATGNDSAKAWDINTSLLEHNPDDYALWTYRRQRLVAKWLADSSAHAAIIKQELALTKAALLRQPKSYMAWHHRRWTVALSHNPESVLAAMGVSLPATPAITADADADEDAPPVDGVAAASSAGAPPAPVVSLEPASTDSQPTPTSSASSSASPASTPSASAASASSEDGVAVDLRRELALCSELLRRDERNFHCHNYRRWLASWSGLTPAEDQAFVDALLTGSPGNYSAWHQRTHALHQAGHLASPDRLAEELALVRRVVFTEPDDSAGWFFHRFVIDCLAALAQGRAPPSPPSLATADSEPRHWGVQASWQRSPVTTPPAAVDRSSTSARRDSLSVLREELSHCEALRSLEADEAATVRADKWPTLAVAHLASVLVQSTMAIARDSSDPASDDAEELARLRGIQITALESLAVSDPMHAGYYRYQLERVTCGPPR